MTTTSPDAPRVMRGHRMECLWRATHPCRVRSNDRSMTDLGPHWDSQSHIPVFIYTQTQKKIQFQKKSCCEAQECDIKTEAG